MIKETLVIFCTYFENLYSFKNAPTENPIHQVAAEILGGDDRDWPCCSLTGRVKLAETDREALQFADLLPSRIDECSAEPIKSEATPTEVKASFCPPPMHWKLSGRNLDQVGGTTTCPGRQLHQDLILALDIGPKEKNNPNSSVCILGPGLLVPPLQYCSPSMHEICHAFHPDANITVVDALPFVHTLQNSTWDSKVRQIAKSVLTIDNARNVRDLTWSQVHALGTYILTIPEKIQQILNCHQQEFAAFVPQKYDYVFATMSLSYSLAHLYEDSMKSRALIAKYLGALKENGRLLIDEQTYKLMKRHITSLPSPVELAEANQKPVSWIYKSRNTEVNFSATSFSVPHSVRLENGHQFIKYCDPFTSALTPGILDTYESLVSDLYQIIRLPSPTGTIPVSVVQNLHDQ